MSRTIHKLNTAKKQKLRDEILVLSKEKGILVRDYEAQIADYYRLLREQKDDQAYAVWRNAYALLEQKLGPVAKSINLKLNQLQEQVLWH
ncbi:MULTISPECIES: hypothetical protein [Lonepinella]|uniref:hypothetical protein n=1 Tax=Lonepinella TaxID=53416 RepID=UPI003F6E21D4